jgi:hypothetical protein
MNGRQQVPALIHVICVIRGFKSHFQRLTPIHIALLLLAQRTAILRGFAPGKRWRPPATGLVVSIARFSRDRPSRLLRRFRKLCFRNTIPSRDGAERTARQNVVTLVVNRRISAGGKSRG